MWDKKRSYSKHNWKKSGVLLPLLFETYDELYNYFLSVDNCEECGISFTECRKCLDHCHNTGLFRNVLCNSCNRIRAICNKNNHIQLKYISKLNVTKDGKTVEVYRVQFVRKGMKYFHQVLCSKVTLDEIIKHRNNKLLEIDGNLDSIAQ
jgi:hypothetical protein